PPVHPIRTEWEIGAGGRFSVTASGSQRRPAGNVAYPLETAQQPPAGEEAAGLQRLALGGAWLLIARVLSDLAARETPGCFDTVHDRGTPGAGAHLLLAHAARLGGVAPFVDLGLHGLTRGLDVFLARGCGPTRRDVGGLCSGRRLCLWYAHRFGRIGTRRLFADRGLGFGGLARFLLAGRGMALFLGDLGARRTHLVRGFSLVVRLACRLGGSDLTLIGGAGVGNPLFLGRPGLGQTDRLGCFLLLGLARGLCL